MMYDITVILLTYNRPEGMLRALDSIFEQTYLNYEVLVIDNGSNTSSHKLVPEEYWLKGNFDYIKFDRNESIGKRLNQGLLLSRGKYITFLTDDSFWCPEALDVLYSAIDMGPDLVCGKVKTLDFKTGRYIPNRWGYFTWGDGEIKRKSPIHITSTILSRKMLEKIGGFNESLVRTYDLDLWNRIYSEKGFLKGRLDDEISHVVVNNPESLSNKYKYDFEPNKLTEENRLKDYLGKRKSLSIIADEKEFINKINKQKHDLVAVHGELDTDYLVTWANFRELDSYEGKIIYYIDYPNIYEENLVDKADALLTQFPSKLDKLCHSFNMTVSKSEIKKIDKVKVDLNHDLRIACINISDDNIDFLYVLLDYLVEKFDKATLICEKNDEIYHLCKDLKGLTFDYLNDSTLEELKRKQPSAVLSLIPDENDYIKAMKSFIAASMIKVPFITTENFSLKDIVVNSPLDTENSIDFIKDGEDYQGSYFVCDKLPDYMKAFTLIRKPGIREIITANARIDLYSKMCDSTMVKELVLFLDELSSKKYFNKNDRDYIISQDKSESKLILNSDSSVSQYVSVGAGEIRGIEVFINPLENYEGELTCLVYGQDISRKSSLKNYHIQKGWNAFEFDPIKLESDIELIFSFRSDVSFFELSYSKYNNYLGLMLINKKPQKACLKFRLF